VASRKYTPDKFHYRPRQLLTSWVAHFRPAGCPQIKWGRTLENALASIGISKEFKEWIAIAKDRPIEPMTITFCWWFLYNQKTNYKNHQQNDAGPITSKKLI